MLLKSQPNQYDYKISKDKYNKTHTLYALKGLVMDSPHTKTQEFRILHKRSIHSGLKLKLGEWFKLNI
jgi:hypothetical protein